MGERIFRRISGGNETGVFGSSKDGKESPLVVKFFEGAFGHGGAEGFDVQTAHELRERYRILTKCYADFLVRQKVIARRDNPDLYFLAQERLQLHQPADVFDYPPDALPEQIKEAVDQLVKLLKSAYQQFTQESNAEVLPLDLIGRQNLVITDSFDLKYVDTGHSIKPFSEMSETEILRVFKARVGWLELLGHGEPSSMKEDAFYADLLASTDARHLREAVRKQSFFEELVLFAGGTMPDDIYFSKYGGEPPEWAREEDDFFAAMRDRED